MAEDDKEITAISTGACHNGKIKEDSSCANQDKALDKHNIDGECEKLLRNTKKQVKQMMEEAVTKKFIHEESSSIISLCVAIDACLSHGLKRRALGLFKTNSSTALIQKVAKNYREAQDILDMVSDEEKKILSEQQQQQQLANNTRRRSIVNLNQQQQQQQQDNESSNSSNCFKQNINQNKSPIKQQASNTNVYRRNLWIKCALIEKKLVSIVDYLSENASKYYESDALMANYLCAQILSSLLVGPSALEFSKSKTNDYYQYNDPTAEELLTRHKLAIPIACLCNSRNQQQLQQQQQQQQLHNQNQEQVLKNPIKFSKSTDSPSTSTEHIKLATTQNSLNILSTNGYSSLPATSCAGLEQPNGTDSSKCISSNRKENRRKPLALKTTNLKRGTLVTDCHHYSCQEMSEHNHTRGYSFLCTSSNSLAAPSHPGPCNAYGNQVGCGNSGHVCQTIQDWSAWSPRMLHETLHQNSKSSLLYAKNNVLLETQPNETMAGYLSLHETNIDLILKWIPNQMINGGQITSSSNNYSQSIQNKENQESSGKTESEMVTTATSGSNYSNHKRPEQPMALESSYLDLVVCLSVSKIVLLHCQFVKPNSINTELDIDEKNLVQTDKRSTEIENQNLDLNLTQENYGKTHETLILIEADGVQRSPFIFPKGGLRVFLSCLETGLRPNKYLDPAIKFDNEGAFDPLEPEIGDMMGRASTPDSPSSSANVGESFGKFDSFLKRLPSLKKIRNKQACGDGSNQIQNVEQTTDNNTEEDLNQNNIAQKNKEETNDSYSPKRKLLQTNHYVYRIVSTQQPDWPLQTPPHSALSVGSSSSGSFALNGTRQVNNQASSQKFRWSLSRLARFSSKCTQQNGSTSSSTSAGGVPINNNNSQSVNSTGGIKSTSTINGSLGSLLSFYQTSVNNSTTENVSIQSDNLILNDSVNQLELASTNKSQTQQEESEDIVDDSQSSDLVRIEAKLNHLKQSTSDDVLQTLRTQSIETLCKSMRKQIVARAFYGWLVYCRKAKIIRTHLVHLIKDEIECSLINYDDYQIELPNEIIGESACIFERGLTRETWNQLMKQKDIMKEIELSKMVNKFVYYGGIENDNLRREVWPYLLEHYKFKDNEEQRKVRDKLVSEAYKSCGQDWIKIERVVKQRDSELLAANMAKVSNDNDKKLQRINNTGENFSKITPVNQTIKADNNGISQNKSSEETRTTTTTGSSFTEKRLDSLKELPYTESEQCDCEDQVEQLSDKEQVIVNDNDDDNNDGNLETNQDQEQQKQHQKLVVKKQLSTESKSKRKRRRRRYRLESTGSVGSDASITDQFGNNIHRIDKDVQRCDRNFWYFKETKNLDKLRNIMCSYVWQHLDVGYVQGMCDLAAPFLVIFDDELMAFNCFNQLMKRMVANFPHGCAMDQHFESLKYLMQVLDPKLYEILQSNGDYTHFYFCYRWLLLDFKRELAYEDVYRVWETIWSARVVVTDHFVVFMALAMVRYYRDIIIENNMDFTDTIKFFNEMAERHDAKGITALARDCIVELQSLIKT